MLGTRNLEVGKVCLGIDWLVGVSGGSDGKESAHNLGDPGSVPGLGRSPGEGNVHLL